MSSDSSDSAPVSKEEKRQILEKIRQEFEDSFETIPDPEERRKRVEKSIADNNLCDSCTTKCLTDYTNCRNAGGSLTNCQLAYNACLDTCP